jgi:hypothetical protein
MNCVILQPSYIPWRGYFHQIAKSDVFVFYDDVQYDKRGWRNRNQIKTPDGPQWLTIPVHSKGAQVNNIPINKIPIAWEHPWVLEHTKAIHHAYRKSPFFENYYPIILEQYQKKPELLSVFTTEMTISIAHLLGLNTQTFVYSSTLNVNGEKTDRLINILQILGATHYITGPTAKYYLEEEKFSSNNISLEYMTYDYREYPQLYPPFEPNVSILDLLFNTGEQALGYIMH